MRLDGKVALITGAAMGVRGELMGFGGASAWLFTGEGARVVLGDINEEKGNQTAAQICESGGEAHFVRLDVTNEQDWKAAVDAAVSRFGRLDILVSSAGTTVAGGVEQTTLEMWQSQMDIHAKGTFFGLKHAVPAIRKSGGGSVVILSSTDGMIGGGFSASYAAAKGANRILARSAAIQYAVDNIRVNSLHPGEADTPLARWAIEQMEGDEFEDPRLNWIPLGRLATADEVAYAILYLASDESSYVTGTEVVIDGGITAK